MSFKDVQSLVIPAFGLSPEILLDFSNIRTADERAIEAKMVNPASYSDLEHCFNTCFNDLKNHVGLVGFQLTLAKNLLAKAKSTYLLDKYPEFMANKPRSYDSPDIRMACLMRDEDYLAALDRINMLEAITAFLEGKIKFMENLSRYMKKKMDLIIRSGLSGTNLYVTSQRHT